MWWIAAVLVLAAPAAAQEADEPDNHIVITGRPRERSRPERPGQGLVARPDEPTRFDTSTQLAGEASLALPKTGRVNAAGFAVPRVRGQDARMTDVFVDELHVQDPYVGLPLVDDLDLRAFGELALYQGAAPPSLATVNPIGAMQLRLRRTARPAGEIGARVGEPFGVSGWLLGLTPDAGIYARQHRTAARYRFYDDNDTPYNEADDRAATRQNNDRVARQLLPRAAWSAGSHSVRALGIWEDARSGLPGASARAPATARESQRSWLGLLRYRYDLGDGALTATAARLGDERGVDDIGARHTHEVASTKTTVGYEREQDVVATWLSLGTARTKVTGHAEGNAIGAGTPRIVERDATTAYLGLALTPLALLTVELKGELRHHTDARHEGFAVDDFGPPSTQRNDDHERTTRGGSIAVGYRAGLVTPYVQLARNERSPTLLEELGDGALVRPSTTLDTEHMRHAEAGLAARSRDGTLAAALAVFRDDVDGRIVLAPALAGSIRAENLGKTRVTGVDLGTEANLGDTRLLLGACAMSPQDLSDPRTTRTIPGIPRLRVTGSVEQHIENTASARWSVRHQSETYRDPLNDVAVPASTLHDASLDTRLPYDLGLGLEPLPFRLGLGLVVANVFDVRSMPVESRDGRKGRTALSDVGGHPLPGRQWSLTLTAAF